MARNSTSTLPSGTETEEWRLMSARVAWLFWLTDRRSQSAPNPSADAKAWKKSADSTRAFVRQVLRHLAAEGLVMGDANATPLDPESEEWRVASARFAWMMWLTDQRASSEPDHKDEAEKWLKTGASFRTYVRKALVTCNKEGIRLSQA